MSVEVSVIIPVYNPPKLLFRKCLESLINQTYQNFEVIIVNDGSKEEYVDIVNYYVSKDSRIKLINKQNEGVSVARNTGIQNASGKFISFVDSDDYVEPNFLDVMVKTISDVDMAICSVEKQWFPTPLRYSDQKSFLMIPEDYMWLQYINFPHNKLYRTDIIKKNNLSFPVGIKLGEDALFLVEYIKKVENIRITDKRLYHYMPNPTSAVNKYNKNFWSWEKSVMEAQYDLFHTYGLSKRQEMFVVKWRYDKIKYLFYYYIDRSNDEREINEMLNEIANHDFFRYVVDSDFTKNIFLNKNDKIILKLWKKYNIKGVKLAKKLSMIVKKIRRR